MIEKKKVELEKIQVSIFDAIKNQDTHKLREQMEVMLFWIRRQIWEQIHITLVKTDPLAAKEMTVSNVRISDEVRDAFGKHQAAIVKIAADKPSELVEQFNWFCTWIDQLIQANVNLHMQPYIKTKIRPINGQIRSTGKTKK